jgi:uncharacterized surface protein with fasciclin (FAS1) repeats
VNFRNVRAARNSTSLVGVIAATDSLSTLTGLVATAGIDNTLQSEGPFTVFAPTNDAFAQLPNATLAWVLADAAVLKRVLLAHVLASDVLTTGVEIGETKMGTANNQTVFVTKSVGGTVTVQNGGRSISATILSANVGAENGIVHLIDAVLLPAAPPGTGSITTVAYIGGTTTTLSTEVEVPTSPYANGPSTLSNPPRETPTGRADPDGT